MGEPLPPTISHGAALLEQLVLQPGERGQCLGSLLRPWLTRANPHNIVVRDPYIAALRGPSSATWDISRLLDEDALTQLVDRHGLVQCTQLWAFLEFLHVVHRLAPQLRSVRLVTGGMLRAPDVPHGSAVAAWREAAAMELASRGISLEVQLEPHVHQRSVEMHGLYEVLEWRSEWGLNHYLDTAANLALEAASRQVRGGEILVISRPAPLQLHSARVATGMQDWPPAQRERLNADLRELERRFAIQATVDGDQHLLLEGARAAQAARELQDILAWYARSPRSRMAPRRSRRRSTRPSHRAAPAPAATGGQCAGGRPFLALSWWPNVAFAALTSIGPRGAGPLACASKRLMTFVGSLWAAQPFQRSGADARRRAAQDDHPLRTNQRLREGPPAQALAPGGCALDRRSP